MQSQDIKSTAKCKQNFILALYIFFKSLVKDFTLKLNLTIYSQQGLEYYNKQYFFVQIREKY